MNAADVKRAIAYHVALSALLLGCSSTVAVEPGPKPIECYPGYELVDGVCQMKEIYFPGGTFTMGRGYCYPKADHEEEFADGRCHLEDKPHSRTIAPFYMDALELHYADFKRDTLLEICPTFSVDCIPAKYWDRTGPSDAYCEQKGRTLPTEAQWEFAATAGGTRTYPWGDNPATCDRVYLKDACDGPAPGLGKLPPSPEGVYDLAGGLRERVLPSLPYPDSYPNTPVLHGSACPGDQYVEECQATILRGGTSRWYEHADSYRGRHRLTDKFSAYATSRCVRPAP